MARKRGRRMTIQRALEIIKNEMPYESDEINEALNMIENAVEKQIPKKPTTAMCYLRNGKSWYISIGRI